MKCSRAWLNMPFTCPEDARLHYSYRRRMSQQLLLFFFFYRLASNVRWLIVVSDVQSHDRLCQGVSQESVFTIKYMTSNNVKRFFFFLLLLCKWACKFTHTCTSNQLSLICINKDIRFWLKWTASCSPVESRLNSSRYKAKTLKSCEGEKNYIHISRHQLLSKFSSMLAS